MASVHAADLPSALAAERSIGELVRGHPVAVFLDYDGTLTPIVERPDDAVLSDEMRAAVREVAARCPVAIVSGRDRQTVERLVGIAELAYVGSHGFDIAGAPGSRIRREVASEFLPALDASEAALRDRLAGIDGALVERKKFTVAVHYRLVAPPARPRLAAIVDQARAQHPTLRQEGGKAVFELRPDIHWDKGTAVRWLLDALGIPDAVACHIGDDLTDETVFAVLAERGIGIIVTATDRLTHARFRLRDPDEVERFLRDLAGALSERIR